MIWLSNRTKQYGDVATSELRKTLARSQAASVSNCDVGWTRHENELLDRRYKHSSHIARADAEAIARVLECNATLEQV